MNDSLAPSFNCKASTALVAYRRVKFNSTGTIEYAGAADIAIGTLLSDIDADVPARSAGAVQRFAAGLHYATYDGASSLSVGDELQAAASGKVTKRTTGKRIGIAKESASADGDIIRVIYDEQASGVDTAEIGYATGAGGTVTQATSASTGVELNKACGQIVTVALSTAAGAETIFTVTNSKVDANDVVAICVGTYAGAGTPIAAVKNVTAGTFDVVITNVHASSAFDAAVTLNFAVIKSVTA